MIATKPTRRPAASAADLARQVETRAAELAGFLAGAELDAELTLDVVANLAAADGLLAVAMGKIAEADPGTGREETNCRCRSSP